MGQEFSSWSPPVSLSHLHRRLWVFNLNLSISEIHQGINLSYKNKITWNWSISLGSVMSFRILSRILKINNPDYYYYVFLFATKKHIIQVICHRNFIPQICANKRASAYFFLICWIEYTLKLYIVFNCSCKKLAVWTETKRQTVHYISCSYVVSAVLHFTVSAEECPFIT